MVLQSAGPIGAPGMPEWGMLPLPKKLLEAGVRDMLRISDARMSGTSYGACILHVAPESAIGGPLAFVRDGDLITLDVEARTLTLEVSDEELAARRAAWKPAPRRIERGYLSLFLNEVTQADEGCDFRFLHAGAPHAGAGDSLIFMKTTPVTTADLQSSVISVPPLCRDAALRPVAAENAKLIRHIEAGGVSTLLYGGNANFYNIALSEYEQVLDQLEAAAAPDTLDRPEHRALFRHGDGSGGDPRARKFPTAMLLPTVAVSSPKASPAVQRIVEKLGNPIVLYIKDEGYVTLDVVKALVAAGAISWIKYAVVRPDPAEDDLLAGLVQTVDPALIVSGIGEQPAIVHWKKFGVHAFTSGCVCVAPRRSQEMLEALRGPAAGSRGDPRALHLARIFAQCPRPHPGAAPRRRPRGHRRDWSGSPAAPRSATGRVGSDRHGCAPIADLERRGLNPTSATRHLPRTEGEPRIEHG